jgi:hypothetical protein
MDKESYSSVMKSMAKKIQKALPEDQLLLVFYSAYDSFNDIPIDNLDEIAVEGKVQIQEGRNLFWGGEVSESYTSEIMENPTWLDLAVCANEMIIKTNDHHHIFLEGWFDSNVRVIGGMDAEDDVRIIRLTMGS